MSSSDNAQQVEVKTETDLHIESNTTQKTKVKRAQTKKQIEALAGIRATQKANAAEKKREAQELKEIEKNALEVRKALYQLDKERKKAKTKAIADYLARQQKRIAAGKKIEPEPNFDSDISSSDDEVIVEQDVVEQSASETESESESESEEEKVAPEPVKAVKFKSPIARVKRIDNVKEEPEIAFNSRSTSPGRALSVPRYTIPDLHPQVNIFR
jgi:hypothetical protein